MTAEIRAAPIAVPESDLEDLRARLARTRWPERELVADWSQGARLDDVRDLCAHWRDGYDWRRCEAQLNSWNPRVTTIDGIDIHFFTVTSPEPGALPVVMTHGWPGSVIEFHKVVAPLTDPRGHGGDPADAVHLVLPSLPGYGFSAKPTETGWTLARIAAAWTELMRRAGFGRRWAAQGGDWGGEVSVAIGGLAPDGCIGIHVNNIVHEPTAEQAAGADEFESGLMARNAYYESDLSGYAKQQSTRPQTIGYALADSPSGQAAWIYEKFHDWTDNTGRPESVLTRDEMLDNIMLYWLPNTGASSARRYWEDVREPDVARPVHLPVALTSFPKDIEGLSRRWAAERFTSLVHYTQPTVGGHFAAFEQPELFVEDVRAGLRAVRDASPPS